LTPRDIRSQAAAASKSGHLRSLLSEGGGFLWSFVVLFLSYVCVCDLFLFRVWCCSCGVFVYVTCFFFTGGGGFEVWPHVGHCPRLSLRPLLHHRRKERTLGDSHRHAGYAIHTKLTSKTDYSTLRFIIYIGSIYIYGEPFCITVGKNEVWVTLIDTLGAPSILGTPQRRTILL